MNHHVLRQPNSKFLLSFCFFRGFRGFLSFSEVSGLLFGDFVEILIYLRKFFGNRVNFLFVIYCDFFGIWERVLSVQWQRPPLRLHPDEAWGVRCRRNSILGILFVLNCVLSLRQFVRDQGVSPIPPETVITGFILLFYSSFVLRLNSFYIL